MDSKYIDWFKFGDENISFVNGMALLTLIPWIKSFNCYDYHNDVILRSPLVGLCKRYPGAWLQPNLDGHTVHSWNIFSYCSAGKSLAWLVEVIICLQFWLEEFRRAMNWVGLCILWLGFHGMIIHINSNSSFMLC